MEHEQAAEETVERPVNRDVMRLIWRNCNEAYKWEATDALQHK